jgi:hypothetical protein
MRKKTFYQQVLKVGANEASGQGFENAIYSECNTKVLTKLWAFEKSPVLYGDCI